MKTLLIGTSVSYIGDEAFGICLSLKTLTIPDNVVSIGNEIFHGCVSLESVSIGKGLTTIPQETFYNCMLLESVTFGSSINSIGKEETLCWIMDENGIIIKEADFLARKFSYPDASYINFEMYFYFEANKTYEINFYDGRAVCVSY
jgi:hypothetical protein